MVSVCHNGRTIVQFRREATLHLTLDRNFTSNVELPGAQLAQDDKRLGYHIYKLTTPLTPGEVRTMKFDVESHPRGFENPLTMTGVVENGSFLNSSSVPQIGIRKATNSPIPTIASVSR